MFGSRRTNWGQLEHKRFLFMVSLRSVRYLKKTLGIFHGLVMKNSCALTILGTKPVFLALCGHKIIIFQYCFQSLGGLYNIQPLVAIKTPYFNIVFNVLVVNTIYRELAIYSMSYQGGEAHQSRTIEVDRGRLLCKTILGFGSALILQMTVNDLELY